MKIDVRHNFPQVQQQLRVMQSDLRDKVIAAALNKTAAGAKTEAARGVTQEYVMPYGEALRRIEVSKANWRGSRLTVTIQAFGATSARGRRQGRSMNVIYFGARTVKPRQRKLVTVRTKHGPVQRHVLVGGGVSVKIKRSGGRKLIPGAFIMTANRGTFVARRIGWSPQGTIERDVESIQTIDLPQMFNSRRIKHRVVTRINTQYPVEVQRAFAAVMRRYIK